MDRDCERFSAWGFGSGATQVKWNRKKEFIIASSHDNKVLIWDTRKGSIPVTKITAHSAKIYGIDWSRENAHELVTCSFGTFTELNENDSSKPC
jgi:WD40 repeat protein